MPKECDTCDKLKIEQVQPSGLRIHINHIGGMWLKWLFFLIYVTCVWNTTSSKSVQTGNNMKMFQKQWNSVNQCTYLCLGHRGLGCDFLRRKIWTVQLILTDNFLTHCFITQLLIVCLSQHRNRNCTDVTFSISEHIIAYGGQHHDQRKARGIALFMVSHPLCFLYVDLGSLRKDPRYRSMK